MKELYRFRQYLTEGIIKEMNEFETADEFVDDGRYYVAVEDNEKGGEWIIDPNQSKYTRGTKTILFTLDEQGYKFTNPEDYFLQVQRMEALKNEAEAEQLISRYGTDLVDQLELHKDWSCAMDPEDCDDDDDDDDDVYEGKLLKEEMSLDAFLKNQLAGIEGETEGIETVEKKEWLDMFGGTKNESGFDDIYNLIKNGKRSHSIDFGDFKSDYSFELGKNKIIIKYKINGM